ncbi:MAG: hypothetical protein JWQ19_3413 [Subtercola sp.]|nr:hypothetical protein [Subtercola sp.]
MAAAGDFVEFVDVEAPVRGAFEVGVEVEVTLPPDVACFFSDFVFDDSLEVPSASYFVIGSVRMPGSAPPMVKRPVGALVGLLSAAEVSRSTLPAAVVAAFALGARIGRTDFGGVGALGASDSGGGGGGKPLGRFTGAPRYALAPPAAASAAASDASSCGTSRFTSPQPSVITKSPGRAIDAVKSAAFCQSSM